MLYPSTAAVQHPTVIYHFACFTTQVVTFTYADGQRPTVNPYSLRRKIFFCTSFAHAAQRCNLSIYTEPSSANQLYKQPKYKRPFLQAAQAQVTSYTSSPKNRRCSRHFNKLIDMNSYVYIYRERSSQAGGSIYHEVVQ